jgi:hypothetical protein
MKKRGRAAELIFDKLRKPSAGATFSAGTKNRNG